MNAPQRPSALADLLASRESNPAANEPDHKPAPRRLRARLAPHLRNARLSAVFPREQRSLFGEILDWMFAPLMLLWPLSVAITFVVARSLADAPFDQALIDRTVALREQMALMDSTRPSSLQQAIERLVHSSDTESIIVQIGTRGGDTLAGDTELPRPHLYDFPAPGHTKLRTDAWRGTDVRIAYTYSQTSEDDPNPPLLIQVAETLDTRTGLANEIIRGVLFPQFLILPLAIALVWFGLSRGLAPLKLLQSGIRERHPDDLSPIDPLDAPEELTPLVDAFNDLLERQSRTLQMQKRFIADAAHQLKTPLAGLRTQAELAMRETDPEQLRRSLEQLAGSAERSAHVVSQLLALARTENLRESITLEPLDLSQLVRELLSECYAESIRRNLDLGFEDGDTPIRIHGHPILLRELVANLIDNAMRYTPATGVINVRLSEQAHEVVLDVEDDGSGIAPDDRERVFDRFYRVLGVQAEGSGLGLSIVREIAAQHGALVSISDGLLWPASRGAGTGTRFTVRFARDA